MFLRHSLELPEDHVITRGWGLCYANCISFLCKCCQRPWDKGMVTSHPGIYFCVFNFQLWNTWSSPALRVRDMLCILQLSSVQQRSGCYFTPNWYLFSWLPVALSTYILWNTRLGPTHTVNRHRKKCIQEAKRLGVIINTFPCLSLLGGSALLDTRSRVSRDSSRTRRMTGNRRRIWCETGSGRGGQQDDGRRGEEWTHHRGGENKSETFRKGPKIIIYLGVICSICVLIFLCLDKNSVIHYTGLVTAIVVGSLTNKRPIWSSSHRAHKYK